MTTRETPSSLDQALVFCRPSGAPRVHQRDFTARAQRSNRVPVAALLLEKQRACSRVWRRTRAGLRASFLVNVTVGR